MIYGHFIEHFHRQIYGGLYDPKSPFSDEKGLRLDVLEAMRKIKVPVLRWPGGCFASSYHLSLIHISALFKAHLGLSIILTIG